MSSNVLRANKRVIIAFSVIFLAIMLLFIWFALEISGNLRSKVTAKFNNSYYSTSSSFADIFHHTEFLMKNINDQIKSDPENLEHINDILSKYKIITNDGNVMSWTIFSWADKNSRIVVDAVYGVMQTPYDLSTRDYIPLTKKYPNRLILGEPVIGSTSKRWMIPGGVGVTDKNGNYVGTLTIGFDLNTVAEEVENSLKDENIKFYIFDKNKKMLIDSTRPQQSGDNPAPANVISKIARINLTSTGGPKSLQAINIIGDGETYLVKKLDDLPFILYLEYNQNAIKHDFWESVTSRIFELVVIGIIAIITVAYVYSRERKLRYKAEDNYQLALSASKGKTEFLAYTGHELRSPLNVIIFGSEMMKSQVFGELSPKYREYAEDIFQNGNDLLHFIEDLMDVTKADEEGSFSLKPEFVDINEIIDRVVKLNITRATKHKVRIEKLVSSDLPKLWADSRRIRQIMNNLISNAIKYSPENTRVRIVAHSIDGVMQIIVEDQGFGMSEEQLDIAMQRYGTVNNENSGKVESIGLGLPLVKQLVDAHNGKFDIESAPEKGTTVTLTFKLTAKL